jgi:hypothetical protein
MCFQIRNPGNTPKFPGKNSVFSCFQAVIAYKCIKVLFLTLGDEFREIQNSGNPRTLCNFEIGKFVPKKHLLQNTLCAAGTLRISGKIGTFSDIFFGNVTNLQKVKKAKKRKKTKKSVENTQILGVFIENRAVAICRSIEKVSKMTPKIPLRAHFSEIP